MLGQPPENGGSPGPWTGAPSWSAFNQANLSYLVGSAAGTQLEGTDISGQRLIAGHAVDVC